MRTLLENAFSVLIGIPSLFLSGVVFRKLNHSVRWTCCTAVDIVALEIWRNLS